MSQLLKHIREDLRKNFKPYSSAGSESGRDSKMIYLNANENPYPFKGLEGLERYDVQQPPALIAAMEEKFGAKAGQLVATRGSDESIDLLIRMFVTAGQDSILICPPAFLMYQVYAGFQGGHVHRAPLVEKDGTLHHDKETILRMAKNPENKIKLVFLCNPHAPSGVLFPREELEEIVKELQGICGVVMDEAYIDFTSQDSFAKDLEKYPHVLVLRTMSKSMALAGERLGATLNGDPEFITFMKGCLAPYPVPKSVSLNAQEALRQSKTVNTDAISIMCAERQRVYEAFIKSDDVAHVYPSVTNFLQVKFISLEKAKDFDTRVRAQNIIIRDISAHPDTFDCLRISVGSPEQNEKLIALI